MPEITEEQLYAEYGRLKVQEELIQGQIMNAKQLIQQLINKRNGDATPSVPPTDVPATPEQEETTPEVDATSVPEAPQE
jgi:hypothetical protein